MAITRNLMQESFSSTLISSVPHQLRPDKDTSGMLVVSDLFLREREYGGRSYHMIDVTNHSSAIRSSAFAEGKAWHAFVPSGRAEEGGEMTTAKQKRAAKEIAEHRNSRQPFGLSRNDIQLTQHASDLSVDNAKGGFLIMHSNQPTTVAKFCGNVERNNLPQDCCPVFILVDKYGMCMPMVPTQLALGYSLPTLTFVESANYADRLMLGAVQSAVVVPTSPQMNNQPVPQSTPASSTRSSKRHQGMSSSSSRARAGPAPDSSQKTL
jgi:hypothetical protein